MHTDTYLAYIYTHIHTYSKNGVGQVKGIGSVPTGRLEPWDGVDKTFFPRQS